MVDEFVLECPNCGSVKDNEIIDKELSIVECCNENCFVATFTYDGAKSINMTEYDAGKIIDVADCPEELPGEKMIVFENYSTKSLRGGGADLRSKDPKEIIDKKVEKVVRRGEDYYIIIEGVRGKVEVSTELIVLEEDRAGNWKFLT